MDPLPLRLEVPGTLAGERFDRALDRLVPGRTRSQLQKLVRRGRVRVDGKKVVRSNFLLRGGEVVELAGEQKQEGTGGGAHEAALEWLHVEPSFAVVAKPAGLLTHPAEGGTGSSVSRQLVERFGPLPTVDAEARPGIVHRLDRWTSGVMVTARTEDALAALRAQFRERSVEKRYLAVVQGVPAHEIFVVEDPLAPEPGPRKRMRVDPDGQEARTSFRVLHTTGDVALVACQPVTGRRHQIRVHLAAAGHPVVGDTLYGTRERGDRHLLHAEELALDHPDSGERMRFHADAPDDFRAFLPPSG